LAHLLLYIPAKKQEFAVKTKLIVAALVGWPFLAWAGPNLVATQYIPVIKKTQATKVLAEAGDTVNNNSDSSFSGLQCYLQYEPTAFDRTIKKDSIFAIERTEDKREVLTMDEIFVELGNVAPRKAIEKLRKRYQNGEFSRKSLPTILDREFGLIFNDGLIFRKIISIKSTKTGAVAALSCTSYLHLSMDQLYRKFLVYGILKPDTRVLKPAST
jgi:hypothetical protein